MTHDPTSHSEALPQPPRDPFGETQHTHSAPQDVFVDSAQEAAAAEQQAEVEETPAEEPEAAQELAEAPENPKRIGRTIARELDKRARVMLERQDSFDELLRQLGVVDPQQPAAGVRGMYVEALSVSKEIRVKLQRLKTLTNEVHVTLEQL